MPNARVCVGASGSESPGSRVQVRFEICTEPGLSSGGITISNTVTSRTNARFTISAQVMGLGGLFGERAPSRSMMRHSDQLPPATSFS